jgi:hypothetical protein
MTDFKSERPGRDEYHAFYEGYVSLVPEGDVSATLERQAGETAALLGGVSEERAGRGYAPGKWSVKELVGHVSDAERVFSYRLLAIARGETRSLHDMDQETYVRSANFNARTLRSLVAELGHVRAATLDLLGGLDAEAWARRGVVNENVMSVRALAHIIAGHEAHHLKVLRERYL